MTAILSRIRFNVRQIAVMVVSLFGRADFYIGRYPSLEASKPAKLLPLTVIGGPPM